ncbi:HesA/MoeB/ThiF family protein [Flavobacterium sp.]|uniref:HesA/MoeB/ThiF family protein n=1 Tax=Flavobacterium sp. TaxID=239 RepID=UPI002869F6B7|nr:HesA/MoeB/ThiF family protein [Flavobacterium sp.]
MKRYQRQIALPEIGIAGQQKLTEAKVLVIGAGGLGCPVLQQLAGAGVGCIGIVDGDEIEESNLHRQVLYTLSDCGKNKATTVAEVIFKQNPEVKVMPFSNHFTTENAFEIIEDYQMIVDCTDNLATRYLINDVALVKKIPMVYASIHRFEGQLSVFNYELGPTYRCLFPEKEDLKEDLNCNDTGVLGILPNTLGLLQATEVLKIILGIGEVLSGKLLIYDALQHQMQTIEIQKNPLQIQNGLLNGLDILNSNSKAVKSITAATFIEAIKDDSKLIIDLRETHEEAKLIAKNIQNIPLNQLENYLENHDKNQKIILFCLYGNKSLLAANYLMKNGFTNVFHLVNGSEALPEIEFNVN